MSEGFIFNQKKSEEYGLRLIREIQLTHAKRKREVQMLPGSNRPVVIEYNTLENGYITFPCTLETDKGTTVYEQSSKIFNWLEQPKDFTPMEFVGDKLYQYLAFHQGDNNLSQKIQTFGQVSIEFILNPYKILKKAQVIQKDTLPKNQKTTLYEVATKNNDLENHLCFPVIKINQKNYDSYEVYLNDQLLVTISGYLTSFTLDTLTMTMKDQWERPFRGEYELEHFKGLSNDEKITIEIKSKEAGTVNRLSVQMNWGTLV